MEEFIKDGEVVLVNDKGLFIYETNVYAYHKRFFALCNSAQYSSKVAIEGVVKSFWKTSHIQICSSLFSAPEQWLRDNEYNRYTNPEGVKKKKIKTEKVNE